MSSESRRLPGQRPGSADHFASALSAWFGDYLRRTDNALHQPMAFFADNHPVEPESLPAPASGRACVLVHGLGCNESLWRFPDHSGDDYGSLLHAQHGVVPLYVRYNSGLRVSDNGRALAALLQRYDERHAASLRELVLIGHSMGGLVLRSACHVGAAEGHTWVARVSHVFYLGSPHLGAPLEKVTHVAASVLGAFDTTATRVLGDLLNTRAVGIKDLRHGNLVDEDWLDHDADALLDGRRVPVPWLASARHHRVVGRLGHGAGILGDAVVRTDSAAARADGVQPAPPGDSDVRVMQGFDHLSLARHPEVYAHIERVVSGDTSTEADHG